LKCFLKQRCVLLAFYLLAIGAQCCCNKGAATKEVEGFNHEKAKVEIQTANEDFIDLLASDDSVDLADAYTINAQFRSGGAPAFKGREAKNGILMSASRWLVLLRSKC